LEAHPVHELRDLIVGQAPSERRAQDTAEDPAIASPPRLADSAKTRADIVAVPEGRVVCVMKAGDGGKVGGGLPVRIEPFKKIGRLLARVDEPERILGFPKEDLDVALTRVAVRRPLTEGTHIPFGGNDVRGLAFQSRPRSDARLPAIDVRPLVGRLGRGRGPPGDGHGQTRQERSTPRDRSHFGLQTGAIGRN